MNTQKPLSISACVLLCVPFTIIAFQPLRVDGYDAEKIGLIALLVLILAAILVGARLKLDRSHLTTMWLRVPIYAALLAFCLSAVLSTVLSLSPALSFLGEPSRMQGLLALGLYVILFVEATRLDLSAKRGLVRILLIAAVPVCLWQLFRARQGLDRLLLGSSAGNPNFLSSWIVMALLYCVPQIGAQVLSWPRPFSWRRWLTLIHSAVLVALMLGSLAASASRGALVGLGAGALFYVIAAIAMARRKRLIRWIGIAAVLAAILYAGAGLIASPGVRLGPLFRVFSLSDPVRLQIWDAAATVLSLQAQPVFTINRQPDSLALLRPVVGYGPDTFEQLQSRFGDIFGPGVAVNSFHNAIYDLLLTQGWVGLGAWAILLECLIIAGLRSLDLLDGGDTWKLLVWQAVGAAAGICLLSIAIAGSSVAAIAPIGAGLGAVAGLIGWTGTRTFRRPTEAQEKPKTEKTIVLAILAVVVGQWVDNQFGFAQGSTQPLFWILLGILAGTATQSAPPDPVADRDPRPGWLACGFVAGMFTLHSFGFAIRGNLFRLENGSVQLPQILLGILGFAVVGALLQPQATRPSFRRILAAVIVTVIVWLAFYQAKSLVVDAVGARLDQVAMQPDVATMAGDLAPPVLALAGSGLIAAFGSAMALAAGSLRRTGTERSGPVLRTVIVIILLVLASSTFYATTYASGVLHNIGSSIMQSPLLPGPQGRSAGVAAAALEAAAGLAPGNVPLRLHWASALALTLADRDDTGTRQRISGLLNGIFQSQPYFVNTLEWRNFSRAYAALLKIKP